MTQMIKCRAGQQAWAPATKYPAPWTWISPHDGDFHIVQADGVRVFCHEQLGCEPREFRQHVGHIVGSGESLHVCGTRSRSQPSRQCPCTISLTLCSASL